MKISIAVETVNQDLLKKGFNENESDKIIVLGLMLFMFIGMSLILGIVLGLFEMFIPFLYNLMLFSTLIKIGLLLATPSALIIIAMFLKKII